MFSIGIFLLQKVTAQNFRRLYIHEFSSDFFKPCNIDNRQYEIYITMTAGMQLFIVREIQLFKVKLKILLDRFNKARER